MEQSTNTNTFQRHPLNRHLPEKASGLLFYVHLTIAIIFGFGIDQSQGTLAGIGCGLLVYIILVYITNIIELLNQIIDATTKEN